MPVDAHTHWLQKAGHAEDEYEDAFATSAPESFPFRAVVADGATESAFSGGWARALVAEFVKLGGLVESAATARTRFSPAPDGRWYVEAKAAEGAHAALLGLELDEDAWRAESVGDCCLFQVRDGRIHVSWPFTDATAFHHRPALISSREAPRDVDTASGTWEAGDTFILATDALAAWLLQAGVEPLLACDDFEGLVAEARRPPGKSIPQPTLRNDDTTAVVIRL